MPMTIHPAGWSTMYGEKVRNQVIHKEKWIIFDPKVAFRNVFMTGRTGCFPAMTVTIRKAENGLEVDMLTHAREFDHRDQSNFSIST